MDNLTPERRSWLMSQVRRSDTKPEIAVRRALHKMGLRFRLHSSSLPGRPDVVLPRWRTVIFVHGCYWHRHHRCRKTTTPSTNRAFWNQKFAANVERDRRCRRALRKAGWKVLVVWECQTADEHLLRSRLS